MSWRERVLKLLRVPHEPSPPYGDEEVHVFRAAPGYMRYRLVLWANVNLGALIGVILALRFSSVIAGVLRGVLGATIGEGGVAAAVFLVEAFAVSAFIVQAVASLLLLRLDIEQRWYLVSNRSIRIREGLVRLHEKTMTLANVQHVSVKQGPLQRLLGIADVEVRSAGGGGANADQPGGKEDLHVAYFRGVADAEAIREAVRERLRTARDAGLGDPDDEKVGEDAQPSLLEAATSLTTEARLLRAALVG